MHDSLLVALRNALGDDAVLAPVDDRSWLADGTESAAVQGEARAVVRPADVAGVQTTVRLCREHGVPIVPRGGGTGYAAGAVPFAEAIVLSVDRLRRVRRRSPETWTLEVDAGLTTAEIRRLAREDGLWFPPDPGAAEQSQIGGNVATNAGGPHCFKYGVVGQWVTGLEVVLGTGEVVHLGEGLRKDVTSLDLRSLVVGSEGTLGVITGVTVRLIPEPEARLPVIGLYPTVEAGAAAVLAALASGVVPAAVEFLDRGAIEASRTGFPGDLPESAGFAVLVEADGTAVGAAAEQAVLAAALHDGAQVLLAPPAAQAERLWAWRDGVSLGVLARHGGKLSEDIVVPVDRIADAVLGVRRIGEEVGLETTSWGHAGDGNLHASFLFDRTDPGALARATEAAPALFDLARRLGGAISGEHGVGRFKVAAAADGDPEVLALQRAVKRTFDPDGIMNPGAKIPAAQS
jgi:glycolate oxidase subunit GlcD